MRREEELELLEEGRAVQFFKDSKQPLLEGCASASGADQELLHEPDSVVGAH